MFICTSILLELKENRKVVKVWYKLAARWWKRVKVIIAWQVRNTYRWRIVRGLLLRNSREIFVAFARIGNTIVHFTQVKCTGCKQFYVGMLTKRHGVSFQKKPTSLLLSLVQIYSEKIIKICTSNHKRPNKNSFYE